MWGAANETEAWIDWEWRSDRGLLLNAWREPGVETNLFLDLVLAHARGRA